MRNIPFAIEQGGETRFEADLALDISAFAVLNGTIILWGVLFATGLHPFRPHAELILGANLLLAIAMVLPCLRFPGILRGRKATKLVLLLAYACIVVSARHLVEWLAVDAAALFLTAVALAALTYLVGAILALISFKGEATIRIG